MNPGRSSRVLGRIAGDRELREEHEVGARVPRLVEPGRDPVGIAGEVADDAVQLGKSESHPTSFILTVENLPYRRRARMITTAATAKKPKESAVSRRSPVSAPIPLRIAATTSNAIASPRAPTAATLLAAHG